MQAFPDAGAEDRELLGAATEAARSAAEAHRTGSPSGSGWAEKARADFVTDVDREAERRIGRLLGERFPGHRIVAEEAADDAAAADRGHRDGPPDDAGDGAGSTPDRRPPGSGDGDAPASPPGAPDAGGDASFAWIVDPLDGTTNWLHGYPEHAVSIAGKDEEGLRVAVVLNSATGELFQALRGQGARRDGEPVHVSDVTDPRMALVGTGFPFKKPDLVEGYLPTLGRLLLATSGVRRGGSAALDLCDLACGRLDAFWELWLLPWDVAAGALILEEAGGVLERLDVGDVTGGGPDGAPEPIGSFANAEGRGYLAATPELLEAFRAVVRG